MEKRQIRFRAWDSKLNKMFDSGGTPMMLSSFFENIAPALVQGHGHLMQFTGLHDKNGKEIFEGDIVRGNIVAPQLLVGDTRENCSTAMGGIVEYNYAGFILRAIQHMCDPGRDGNVNWFPFAGEAYDGDFEDMEVIGNIYENPELLSGEAAKQ